MTCHHLHIEELNNFRLVCYQDGADFYDVSLGHVFTSRRVVKDHDMDAAILAREDFELWAAARGCAVTWESPH